jgi:hypothetical protein
MSRPEPYFYVRYTWWKAHDIVGLTSKLKERFTVMELRRPDEKGEFISLGERDIARIEVKADTLSAYIAPSKAVLFQKESAPFTKRDMELRETLLALYPHVIPAPIPLFYRREPKFKMHATS